MLVLQRTPAWVPALELVWVPVTPRIGGRAEPAGIPHKARSREESGQAEAALASAQEWELVLARELGPVLVLARELVLAQELEWALVSAQEWVSETVEEWETAEVLGLGPAWV